MKKIVYVTSLTLKQHNTLIKLGYTIVYKNRKEGTA